VGRPRKNPNESRDQAQRAAQSDNQIVDIVTRMIKPGEDALRVRKRRYDDSYDIYRASERRPRSLEPWQSKLRVPYAMQVIDTALVNIVTGVPRVNVKPRHPDVTYNAKAMQVALDYYVAEDHLVEAQPIFAQQGLIYGATVAKNHWLYEDRTRTARSWQSDAGMPPMSHVGPVQEVVRDGPTFEVWNIYDAWWDTTARDVDNAAYFVLRSWLSKDQLTNMQCSKSARHDRQECDGVLHNLEDLFKAGTSGKPDTTAQQRFLQGAAGNQQIQSSVYKDLFEILEVWTNDTVTVIGSRKVLLRNDPNPYWHGRKPVVLAQTRPDLFQMQGIPETELVDHLQQAQWTLQNMTIDNLHLTTMRGVTYREGGVTDPNALQLRPRFKWPVVDHDDIKPFEIPPIASDVYQERTRLLSDMQLVTGINPYVSGADLSSVDQNTATGVTALQEVASRLLRFKAAQLQYKGYQRTFEMWGDMIQQFMDKSIAVQITGTDGQPTWLNVDPHNVAGHFDYVLEGSEESLSRQQERGEAVALLNAFAPLAQLGFINFKPILERVGVAYDFPDPEQLFIPPQAQPPAAPGQPPQQPNPGMAPTQEQLDQQQQQQNGNRAPDLYNVRGPQIGENVYQGRREQQGGIQMDPQLIAALSRIRGF
jgi:hypothetical protein